MPKYKFNANGALVNPDNRTNGTNQLAVVTSIQQVEEMSNENIALTLPPSTVKSLEIVQSADYRNNFRQENPSNDGELLEELSREFNKLELSLGLLEKLRLLQGRHLNFLLDDSGSMAGFSDVPMSEAHPALKAKYDTLSPYQKKRMAEMNSGVLTMTRWAEEQNRLHIMIELLAYIPTGPISFTFINNLGNTYTVTPQQRQEMTPTQFKELAHQAICEQFDRAPPGGTPLHATLSRAFQNNSVPMVHYLMTDGEPGDCSKIQLQELIETRGLGYRGRTWNKNNVPADVQRKAELNPLMLISCTNNNDEVAYFKDIDDSAPMVAEVDDFKEEKNEVVAKQGNAFPFTKGLWILCQLVAALDPWGLDNLDEAKYLPMEFLSLLVGHQLTAQDYDYYKQNHPNTPRSFGMGQNSQTFYNNPPPQPRSYQPQVQQNNCVIC